MSEATVTLSERRWPEMWGYVQRAHERLNAHVAVPSDQVEVRAEATTFFILCIHLADWVGNDSSNNLTLKQCLAAIQDFDAMDVCRAFANTSKHAARSRRGAADAQISDVTVRPRDGVRPTSANIAYVRNDVHLNRDMMELADDCIAWWERFIVDHNLLSS